MIVFINLFTILFDFYILECNELVVLLFCFCYEKICIHKSTLETVSVKVSELYPDPGKVVIGNASRYETCKYKTHYLTIYLE